MPQKSQKPPVEQIRKHLERQDLERAWQAALPWREALDHSHELAVLWVALLRHTRGYPHLLDDARRLAERWSSDGWLMVGLCDALVRAAEQRPIDEPPLQEAHPAALATDVSRRGLDALGPDADPDLAGYLRINLANGLRLSGPGHWDEAAEAYAAALAAHPDKGWWWFNLGLLQKLRGDWEACLEATGRARAHLGDERPVLWNLALCQTALGRGADAVASWQAVGVPAQLADSGMPYVPDLEPVEVRVATVGPRTAAAGTLPDQAVGFELVWVHPLSPCHGVIQSPTFREASVDYGDLILWDGAPVGARQVEDRKVPIFPLLARLRGGDERRYRFVALQDQAGRVEALGAELPMGAQLFVHQQGKDLSHLRGRGAPGLDPALEPEAQHVAAAQGDPPLRLVYGKLILPADADLVAFRRALDARLRSHPKVNLVLPGLLEDIGDTKAAGKAHQAWRGVERAAERRRAQR